MHNCRREASCPYPETLLLSRKESPETFEAEAHLLLAVKLYELSKVSTGTAATLAGMSRVAFMFALSCFGLSPLGVKPGEPGRGIVSRYRRSPRSS